MQNVRGKKLNREKVVDAVKEAKEKVNEGRRPLKSERFVGPITKVKGFMERYRKRQKRDVATSTALALVPVNSNGGLNSAYGSELVQTRSKRWVNKVFFDIPITAAIAFKVDMFFVASYGVSYKTRP